MKSIPNYPQLIFFLRKKKLQKRPKNVKFCKLCFSILKISHESTLKNVKLHCKRNNKESQDRISVLLILSL